jgi:5-formyltetrahydrofolate cyclo-ligase
MTKEALRKIYRAKRNELSESEFLQMSRQLSDRFFLAIDLSIIKIVHIYLPIESKKEPDTWLIVERIRREFSTHPIINTESKRGSDGKYFL